MSRAIDRAQIAGVSAGGNSARVVRGDKTQLANVFDPSMSGNAQAHLIWVCALEPHRIVDSIP